MVDFNYPQTETEIRIYCLEASRGTVSLGSDGDIDLDKAQRLYDFICSAGSSTPSTSDTDRYWYLREGDFLPEPIESMCESWHRSRGSVVEFLSECGNIFTSMEEAAEASRAVRAALIAHRVLRGHRVEIRTSVDSPRCGQA